MNACVVIGPGGALAVSNVGLAGVVVVHGVWVKTAFGSASRRYSEGEEHAHPHDEHCRPPADHGVVREYGISEGEVQELLETRTPKMQKEFMLLFERRSLYQIQNKFHFSRHERGGEEKKGERELQYAEYLPDNAQKHASAYASAEYMFGTRWTERQKTA